MRAGIFMFLGPKRLASHRDIKRCAITDLLVGGLLAHPRDQGLFQPKRSLHAFAGVVFEPDMHGNGQRYIVARNLEIFEVCHGFCELTM